MYDVESLILRSIGASPTRAAIAKIYDSPCTVLLKTTARQELPNCVVQTIKTIFHDDNFAGYKEK